MVTQYRHFIKSLAYNKQTLISNNLFVGKYNCDLPSQVLVYYPIDLTTLILVRLLMLATFQTFLPETYSASFFSVRLKKCFLNVSLITCKNPSYRFRNSCRHLGGNQLKKLPRDIFHGLTNLEEL